MLADSKPKVMQIKESQIHIRLSESEKIMVRKASAIKNSSMSQFLRGAVMSAAKELLSREASQPPVFLSESGEYFFRDRPKINVFSNLYKFRESKLKKSEWCSLYGLSPSDFDFALDEIAEGHSLYLPYQKWLEKEEESLDAF
jgi:hypothetical protein